MKLVRRSILVAFSLCTLAVSAAVAPLDATAPATAPVTGPKSPSENVDWSAVAARGKLALFETLADTLRDGRAGPTSVVAFESLIQSPEQLARIRSHIAKLGGPEHKNATNLLFAELMLADSDADIVYEAASKTVDTIFKRAAADTTNYATHFSWSLSRPMMACLLAYEATKDARFLDLMADAFDRMLPLRDDALGRVDELHGRVMRCWGGPGNSHDVRYGCTITTAGRTTYPMAMWASIVLDDPTLAERYGDRAQRYLNAASETLQDFHDDYRVVPGTTRGYYAHIRRKGAEPLNHMAWMANSLLTVGRLTNNQDFVRKARGIAEYFKTAIWTDEGGCWIWRYEPAPDNIDTKVDERSGKAVVTLDLPMHFARAGVVFTTQDMQQFSRTVLTNIYRGDDIGPGKWNELIVRQFKDLEEFGRKYGGLLCVTNFIRLDEYNPRVRVVIEELVATRSNLGGWLANKHGLVAYAHRLGQPGFNKDRTAEALTYPTGVPLAAEHDTGAPDESDDDD